MIGGAMDAAGEGLARSRNVTGRFWVRWCCVVLGTGALLLNGIPTQEARAGASSTGGEPRGTYYLAVQGIGLGVVYNRKDLLPFAPLLNVGMPKVSLELDDTPTSSARATALDPGIISA